MNFPLSNKHLPDFPVHFTTVPITSRKGGNEQGNMANLLSSSLCLRVSVVSLPWSGNDTEKQGEKKKMMQQYRKQSITTQNQENF